MRRMITKMCLASIMVYVCYSVVTVQACYGMDATVLADLCESMEEAIVDISVTYEWEMVPPVSVHEVCGKGLAITKGADRHSLSASRPFLERFVYTRGGTFMDEYGRCHDMTSTTSYDKGLMRHFQESAFPADGNSPAVRYLDGAISRRKPGQPSIATTPLRFTVLNLFFHSATDGEGALSDRLRRKDGVVIEDSNMTVNGFRAIKADFLMDDVKKPYITVHFAIDFGYTPIRFTFFSGPDKPAIVTDVNSIEKTSNGLWFPTSGTLTMTGQERIAVYRTTAPVVLNQGVSDEALKLEFPPGTRVSDEITGKEYIVKPTQEQLDESLPK